MGVRRDRRGHAASVGRRRRRRDPRVGGCDRRGRRARPGPHRTGAVAGSVPFARRRRTTRVLHRRARRDGDRRLRESADRGADRLHGRGVDGRSQPVAPHPASGRPRPGPGRERPTQRDGRALPARVPAHASGWARRLGARPGARRPRRARQDRRVPRRPARCHDPQTRRRTGRLPHLSRRAHGAALARDVRGARRALGGTRPAPRRRRRGLERRPGRLPIGQRLARAPRGRWAVGGGGRSAP